MPNPWKGTESNTLQKRTTSSWFFAPAEPRQRGQHEGYIFWEIAINEGGCGRKANLHVGEDENRGTRVSIRAPSVTVYLESKQHCTDAANEMKQERMAGWIPSA
jgi:hypothetical protein